MLLTKSYFRLVITVYFFFKNFDYGGQRLRSREIFKG